MLQVEQPLVCHSLIDFRTLNPSSSSEIVEENWQALHTVKRSVIFVGIVVFFSVFCCSVYFSKYFNLQSEDSGHHLLM